MAFKMWMLDVAREQSLTHDHLYQYAGLTQDAGYDALGLYLEHRYAYRSTPWSSGKGVLTSESIRNLQFEFPSLQIIPFINLLGHFEGFLYTEEGKMYREELFNGLQACPSCPEFVSLCGLILDEIMQDFTSPIIHLGGDETAQLGVCERCRAQMEGKAVDEKAWLYAEHFGPLCKKVVDAGRVPALWGDMFLEHPSALTAIPKETIIFDWQYMNGVAETSAHFEGFEVMGCPALHVYNAAWMHMDASEKNVREVARDVQNIGLKGVCLTVWEGGTFASFDTLFPAITWASDAMDRPDLAPSLISSFGDAERWASLMGMELEKVGGVFAFKKQRSGLKSRLLLFSNPFLAWMHHGVQLCGPDGDRALKICEEALHFAPSEAEKGVTLFVRGAIEFIRLAEAARLHYAKGEADAACGSLAPARYLFETLERVAVRNHARIGGSMADAERCKAARLHIEKVIGRIRQYGRHELGYLPAFEVITNPRFMPHDQGCWWLINKWANQ